MSVESLIREIPKCELHLHIEGSLEPELMMELAKKNNIPLKHSTIEELKATYNFSDLQSFLDIYYEAANVLCNEDAFFELTWAYLKRAHEDNVVHTEIFFDPQTHTHRGIAFSEVITGIDRALKQAQKEFSMSSELIMCFLRHLDEEDAFKTLEQAKPFLHLIKGVGLDSAEKGNPPSKFERVFAECKKLNLELVAHAGEEGPADYVWEALKLLGVSRIDHGVRSIEDAKLVEHLKEHRIPLTVCPLSNVKLRVFDKLSDHNLKELLDQGLCATVNSDDPAYFGGYINTNFLECAKELNLTKEHIKTLCINSFEASYMDENRKTEFINKIRKM